MIRTGLPVRLMQTHTGDVYYLPVCACDISEIHYLLDSAAIVLRYGVVNG